MTDAAEVGEATAERARHLGFPRISLAYGITLLAAVLGLPVVGAGLITSNNCQLRGYDCDDRLAYGLVGAIVLAAVTQLMLGLHFRLGWAFWISSSLLMAAAGLNLGNIAILVGVVLIAPGLAAWVSEPPNRRRGVLAHWTPRYAVWLGVVLIALSVALLL
jgi:hypothetical protein